MADRLIAGDTLWGSFLKTPSPILAEDLASAGLDLLCIGGSMRRSTARRSTCVAWPPAQMAYRSLCDCRLDLTIALGERDPDAPAEIAAIERILAAAPAPRQRARLLG